MRLEMLTANPPTQNLEKRVQWIILGAVALSFAGPCAAAGFSAADIESRLTKEAAACPPEGTRLKIERIDLVGAGEHNRLRRAVNAKTDGREGQRYAMVVVRHGKQVASVASFGPVEAVVKAQDLIKLRGATYCDRDEN